MARNSAHHVFRLACLLTAAIPLTAQQPDTPAAKESTKDQPHGRLFGILPNYRSTDAPDQYTPLSTKQKFTIARKDAFDLPIFFITGGFAAMYQMQDRNPSYGQGMAGYGRRYAAALGDQAIGTFLSEAIFPAVFHSDPRYFRLGPEKAHKWKRTGYALSRILITRTDRGGSAFNFSGWSAAGTGVAVSNLYYPADNRNVRTNLAAIGLGAGTDALTNVLREFWPDWKSKFTRK